MIDKNEICFIKTKQRGYDPEFLAVEKKGYNILIPYSDYNLLMRCLREFWFRMKLPFKSLWYNPKIKNAAAKLFILRDPLMTQDFMSWLRNIYPESRIVLYYSNRADKSSICPSLIDDKLCIEKWSYDKDDCKKYNMHHTGAFYGLDIFKANNSQQKVYDVVYLGRDKGRAEMLFDLQKQLNELGLKTYFHICADRSFLKFKHSFYKPLMPYAQYIELIGKTRAILNIMPEGQKSITMRDMECVFNGIKGITNNKGIKDFELYHPSRFFVIGEDNINGLPKFLNEPFVPISEKILEKYKFEVVITKMVDRME